MPASPGRTPKRLATRSRRCKNIIPAALSGGQIGREQIETAFLLGQGRLNQYLLAISVGSVFFGAATYLGNGPNFMVKSIAARQQVPAPGFVGFIFKYSLPCLAPMLLLIWLLFFRR